jgi:hypothetical protein
VNLVDDTPDDWTDDNVVEIASNDATSLVLTTLADGATAGSSFRTIDIFDHLEISPQASVSTNGDIYVIDGSLSAPSRSSLALQNSFITLSGSAGVNASLDLTLSGLTSAVDTLNVGSLRLVSGTLTTREVRTSGDLVISGGTLTHPATSTTTVSSLNLTIGGALSMLGGTINVTGRGYPSGYSYGPTGPSTALAAAAGSHGGAGDSGAPVYDDYRNPRLPGGGGANGFVGGGVVMVNAVGRCTIENGATIVANGTGSAGYGAGAGGTVNLRCGGFGGSAGAAAITASGAPGHNSGGGRIALVSSGTASSFAGSFDYNANLATFKSRVRAYGGGTGAGAGTIFVKSSNLAHGDLIVDNGGIVGTTPMLDAAANGQVVFANNTTSPTTELRMTSAATPYANRVNLFVGQLFDIFPTGNAAFRDPRSADRVRNSITANGTNTLVASGAAFPTVNANHEFRLIYVLDHLEVGGRSTLAFGTADVIVDPTGGLTSCDLHSGVAGRLEIPTASVLTGNAMASTLCPAAQVVTQGTTVNFNSYFLP